MFNKGSTTTAISTGFNDSLESKYTVAEILSSMTNTTPVTPTTLTSGAYSSTGSLTGTTPTLTPTTLNSIEQTFINLQNNAEVSRAQDLQRESGFIPPVVHPHTNTPVMVQIKSEVDYYDDSSLGSEQDFNAQNPNRLRNEDGSFSVPNIDPNTYLVANSRRPTGPRKDRKNEMLSPEEEMRRKQRRERNKQAAAKCRQRREDHTSRLINETEGLEEEKSQLENEIQTLHQQKEQLEFILQAHKTNCHVGKQRHLKAPSSTIVPRAHPYNTVRPSSVPSTVTNVCSTRPNTLPIPNNMLHSNVSSLPSVTEATGVAINTPSTGIGMFSFDHTIVEGHTELTPINCGPVNISTSTVSCAGQMKRRSTDSSSSNDLSSPTLISL